MAVITISREPGTFGEEVAARVAGKLGFLLVDKARLSELWGEADLDDGRLAHVDETLPGGDRAMDPETEACLKLLPELIGHLAEDHDLVVVGRGGQCLFRDRPGTLHVRIVAARHFRVRQLRKHEGWTVRETRRRIRAVEKQRSEYLRFLYQRNWSDPSLYDLVLNMERLAVAQAVNLISTAFDELRLQEVPRWKIVENLLPEAAEEHENGRFVNASEREFARFLDFYRIPYAYEPRTFILETDADGTVVEAFTPDFYLTEQDLYIELTTMKQSLVTRKNRKVRKLRKLHPEINIRIFYQRDYRALLAKYGILKPNEESSIDG